MHKSGLPHYEAWIHFFFKGNFNWDYPNKFALVYLWAMQLLFKVATQHYASAVFSLQLFSMFLEQIFNCTACWHFSPLHSHLISCHPFLGSSHLLLVLEGSPSFLPQETSKSCSQLSPLPQGSSLWPSFISSYRTSISSFYDLTWQSVHLISVCHPTGLQ